MPTISKSTQLEHFLTLTSNWISRLFWSGHAEGGIQKMRSKFFEKAKSSGSSYVPTVGRDGGNAPNNKLPAKTKTLLTIKI